MTTFSNFLNSLTAKMGQGTLADEIGIDGAALSRFKSGQGTINLAALDKIFKIANVTIIPRAELRKMEDALETISELWKKERRQNLSGGNGSRKEENI